MTKFNHIVVVSGAGSLGLGMVAAARQKVLLDIFYTLDRTQGMHTEP